MAEENFMEALSKEPTNVQFYRSLSRCYYDQDKYEKSIMQLEKAQDYCKEPDLKCAPFEPAPRREHGHCCVPAGDRRT